MSNLDAKGTLILKANYALVRAALQTVPEELAVEARKRQHQSEHSPPLAIRLPHLGLAWLGLAGTNAVLLTVVSSGF